MSVTWKQFLAFHGSESCFTSSLNCEIPFTPNSRSFCDFMWNHTKICWYANFPLKIMKNRENYYLQSSWYKPMMKCEIIWILFFCLMFSISVNFFIKFSPTVPYAFWQNEGSKLNVVNSSRIWLLRHLNHFVLIHLRQLSSGFLRLLFWPPRKKVQNLLFLLNSTWKNFW